MGLSAKAVGKKSLFCPAIYAAIAQNLLILPPLFASNAKTRFTRRLISATAYKEPMVSLIHLFKYRNCDYLDEFFSTLIIKHLKNINFRPFGYDFIIPVPMHKHKLKIRGYNQARLLAKLLSNSFKIPLRDDIINTVNFRPSQAKLRKQKRQENVEGAFAARKNLKNKKIILVDDIFTTGATAMSCCQALLEKQAAEIIIITLSKA